MELQVVIKQPLLAFVAMYQEVCFEAQGWRFEVMGYERRWWFLKKYLLYQIVCQANYESRCYWLQRVLTAKARSCTLTATSSYLSAA